MGRPRPSTPVPALPRRTWSDARTASISCLSRFVSGEGSRASFAAGRFRPPRHLSANLVPQRPAGGRELEHDPLLEGQGAITCIHLHWAQLRRGRSAWKRTVDAREFLSFSCTFPSIFPIFSSSA